MPHDPLLPRYVSKERAAQLDDEWRARLSGAPTGHVPYRMWSRQVDEHCRARKITLAEPKDFAKRFLQTHPHMAPLPNGEDGQFPTVEHLLQYQEAFYTDRYHDPAFTFDRARLHLPKERVDGILDALTRKEVNYPLVVATPRQSMWSTPGVDHSSVTPPTLHRFLMDRLIRAQNIKVWQRTDPNVDTFLEQMRDLTTTDLTRTDLTDADGKQLLGTDGQPLRFETIAGKPNAEQPWLRYLQTLYPTLPRPTVQPGYLDCSFTAWERDPPATRIIPNATDPRGGAVTIQGKSQLDAVRFQYPLITPSRHLALFAQYHAATGEYLDTATWSWTLGVIDPERFPDGPSVHALWCADGLILCRDHPGYAHASGRLRVSR